MIAFVTALRLLPWALPCCRCLTLLRYFLLALFFDVLVCAFLKCPGQNCCPWAGQLTLARVARSEGPSLTRYLPLLTHWCGQSCQLLISETWHLSLLWELLYWLSGRTYLFDYRKISSSSKMLACCLHRGPLEDFHRTGGLYHWGRRKTISFTIWPCFPWSLKTEH